MFGVSYFPFHPSQAKAPLIPINLHQLPLFRERRNPLPEKIYQPLAILIGRDSEMIIKGKIPGREQEKKMPIRVDAPAHRERI